MEGDMRSTLWSLKETSQAKSRSIETRLEDHDAVVLCQVVRLKDLELQNLQARWPSSSVNANMLLLVPKNAPSCVGSCKPLVWAVARQSRDLPRPGRSWLPRKELSKVCSLCYILPCLLRAELAAAKALVKRDLEKARGDIHGLTGGLSQMEQQWADAASRHCTQKKKCTGSEGSSKRPRVVVCQLACFAFLGVADHSLVLLVSAEERSALQSMAECWTGLPTRHGACLGGVVRLLYYGTVS